MQFRVEDMMQHVPTAHISPLHEKYKILLFIKTISAFSRTQINLRSHMIAIGGAKQKTSKKNVTSAVQWDKESSKDECGKVGN